MQPGNLTSKEGIDIGGDLVHGSAIIVRRQPAARAESAAGRGSLAGLARVSCRSLPGDGAGGTAADASPLRAASACPRTTSTTRFGRGLSTLRLIRYPPRIAAELASVQDPAVWVRVRGDAAVSRRRAAYGLGLRHALAQDGVAGLQARSRSGRWLDVPPLEGTLVVNFGQVLEQWSAGRIRATEHRVLGSGRERFSIPFFYEARADATITPLPLDRPDLFAPFEYGDFLWKPHDFIRRISRHGARKR